MTIAALLGIATRGVKTSIRLRLNGVPRIEGDAKTIAKHIIQKNSSDGIIKAAGAGSHFPYEWIVDSAKAFRGMILGEALPNDFLRSRVEKWIETSLEKGHVPSCFSGSRSFNLPRYRLDSLPWLIHAADCVGLAKERGSDLEVLLKTYLDHYFDHKKFLLRSTAIGDWADSLHRPSSTYNNLCLLRAFVVMEDKGYQDHTKKLEESLLSHRWTGEYFIDYEGSDDGISGDAAATALYFELFEEAIRNRLADSLESSTLLRIIPLKIIEKEYHIQRERVLSFSPHYHSCIWPHMGCMALVGFRALGRNMTEHQEKIENTIKLYGNFVEVFDKEGEPYKRALHVTAWNFTMFAGLYLELVA